MLSHSTIYVSEIDGKKGNVALPFPPDVIEIRRAEFYRVFSRDSIRIHVIGINCGMTEELARSLALNFYNGKTTVVELPSGFYISKKKRK